MQVGLSGKGSLAELTAQEKELLRETFLADPQWSSKVLPPLWLSASKKGGLADKLQETLCRGLSGQTHPRRSGQDGW